MYEYERTCNRCGTIRYVPAEVAEMRPRKQAKAVGWATPLVGKRRQQIRADQALVDAHNRAISQANQCPNCGSTSYAERRTEV
jgi:hypothetical protein